jgi:hypothetical protein
MNIKAGYWLAITSWENDGDNYKTQNFYGLTEEDVKLYLDIVTWFRSTSQNDGGLGGGAWHYPGRAEAYKEIVVKIFDDALARNPGASEHVKELFTVDKDHEYAEDRYFEILDELLGTPGEDYDGLYIRVFERFEVHFLETDVQDVTSQFPTVKRQTI